MIYSQLIFISHSYTFTLMMQEGQFPIESPISLSGVIASNFIKLAKANFGGITESLLLDEGHILYRLCYQLNSTFNYLSLFQIIIIIIIITITIIIIYLYKSRITFRSTLILRHVM
jgi:hypothetical protein